MVFIVRACTGGRGRGGGDSHMDTTTAWRYLPPLPAHYAKPATPQDTRQVGLTEVRVASCEQLPQSYAKAVHVSRLADVATQQRLRCHVRHGALQ